MNWLWICAVMVSGMAIGIVYCKFAALVYFIQNMDNNDAICESCEYRTSCIAPKPIGVSNWMTEFTLLSFLSVQKKCTYAQKKSGFNTWILSALNGIFYVLLFLKYGFCADMILFALSTTVLLYIGIVDWKTQYIPFEFNILIFVFGLTRLIMNPEKWIEQVVGLFVVSLFLLLVDQIGSRLLKGKHVIGGGDIKLMAAAGLLLGWKLNIVAFVMGCICGSVIHLIIMKIGKGEHQLAFGPYLAMGIYIAMICGEQLMSWYLGIMGL